MLVTIGALRVKATILVTVETNWILLFLLSL